MHTELVDPLARDPDARPKRTTVSTYLDASLLVALKRAAKAAEMSESGYIRAALAQALEASGVWRRGRS